MEKEKKEQIETREYQSEFMKKILAGAPITNTLMVRSNPMFFVKGLQSLAFATYWNHSVFVMMSPAAIFFMNSD